MRLKEIHNILINNREPIIDSLGLSVAQDKFVHVKEYKNLLDAISTISKTKLIDVEIADFDAKSLSVMYTGNTVKFTIDRYKDFSDILKRINIKIEAVDTLVRVLYDDYEERDDTLVISMPDRSMKIDDFNKIISKIDETFDILTMFPEFKTEQINISDFDKGSNWILLILGSIAALTFFGKIVLIAQQIKMNGLNIKHLEKQYEKYGLEQDAQHQFLEAARQISTGIYRDAATKLIDENEIEKTEENLTYLAKAIEHVRSLNEMGVAFKAGINSSIETTRSFPPISQQKELDMNKQIDSILNLPKKDND